MRGRPGPRLIAKGYVCWGVAENPAFGQAGPEDVVDACMAGPDHRTAILGPAWHEVGVAVRVDGADGRYRVLVLADPARLDEAADLEREAETWALTAQGIAARP